MKSTRTKQSPPQADGRRRRMPRDLDSSPTSASRRGFTLIEIMVVLIIVGILMALLLPAIMRARLKAIEARVKVEISTLSQAVEEFKERYGVYPPSAITLIEDPLNDPSGYILDPTDTSIGARVQRRTVALFQRIWPDFPILTCQFDFDGDGNFDDLYGNGSLSGVDFNGNGMIDQGARQLVGAECLAFFLGGMPQGYVTDNTGAERLLQGSGFGFADIERRAFLGFSRNPILPFSRPTDVYGGSNLPVPGRDERFPPLFEFNVGRLVDSDPDLGDDPDGFWEYLDSIEANPNEPYRYLSSYQGQAYNSISVLRALGAYIVAADPSALPGVSAELGDELTRDFVTPPAPFNNAPAYTFLPYYAGAPVDNNGIIDSQIQWFNPRSFQIISPGVDGRIGYGGRFNPDGGEGPWSGSDGRDADGDGSDEDQEFDMDNITNFSEGRLSQED